jgi:hypothetical protein
MPRGTHPIPRAHYKVHTGVLPLVATASASSSFHFSTPDANLSLSTTATGKQLGKPGTPLRNPLINVRKNARMSGHSRTFSDIVRHPSELQRRIFTSSVPQFPSRNLWSPRDHFPFMSCWWRIKIQTTQCSRTGGGRTMGRRFGRLRSSLSSKVLAEKTPEASAHPPRSPRLTRTSTGQPAPSAAHSADPDSSKRPPVGPKTIPDKNLLHLKPSSIDRLQPNSAPRTRRTFALNLFPIPCMLQTDVR